MQMRLATLNHNWERVFLVGALAVFALNVAGLVMNIIGIITIIGINVINIYCTFFSFLTLSAELRQFSLFRRFVSVWLKYFTFLLFYRSRGIFYIMYGLLLIGTAILTTVAGGVAIALGIIMIGASFFADLPVYSDMKEAQSNYEAKIRQYSVEQDSASASGPGATELQPSSSGVPRPPSTPGGTSSSGGQINASSAIGSPRESSGAPPSNAFNLRPSDFDSAQPEDTVSEGQGYANLSIIGPSAFASRVSINQENPEKDT